MITGVRHIGIVVTDMERSLRFYRDLLGLTIERNLIECGEYIDNMLSMKNVKVNTIKMSAKDKGPTLIELLEFKSHQSNSFANSEIAKIGASHVAFTVDDLDKTYSELITAGIKFNAPPQYSPDGYAKVTFCHDPDGTPIELVQVLNSSVLYKPEIKSI